MLKKIFLFIALIAFSAAAVHAQVTTSSITGVIKNDSDQPLSGATVKAVHVPSGTVYNAVASSSGVVNMQGLRPGGPYTIEISYTGLATKTLNEINIPLGESFSLNEQLSSSALEGVVVTATVDGGANRDKTGASTNISTRQLTQLPTLSRSITDFTKLTPQSNGNSFAGRDGRYNNVQVDGANFNNGFGLNDEPLPGGGGLSLDAIEQIQVNIAPYDVRQGGFTGAGINAITRSGTNKIIGSAYHYWRNEGLLGRKVNGEPVSGLIPSSTKTYGFRLGGPIIKNKLFFFVNAEKIDREGPDAGATNLWKASEDGVANQAENITRVRRSDIEAVRNHLVNQWGYDPGAYEGYANGQSQITSMLARIDWNISDKHKLALRYNSTKSSVPNLVNANSGPNPRSNFDNYARVGINSMAFENTMYFQENTVKSFTAELNSRLSDKVSNQFLATFSKINSDRTSNSAEFPMIDIGDGLTTVASGVYQNYITAGYELFSFNNSVINDNLNIFNNVNYTTGKHAFTFGGSFEMQKFGNSYQREGTSYYRYASVEDFLRTGTPQEVAPIQFGLTYVYPGMDPYAKVTYFLPALYIQDNITVSDKFSLTVGLRAEMPKFKDDLTANPVVDSLSLLDVNGNVVNYGSAQWPKTRIMLSPRVGFRWDVFGDKDFVVRGGTGIFAGRVPFVWLTNQPTNTGVIQNLIEPGSYAASASWIDDIRFNPNRTYWLDNTPASASNVFIKSPSNGVPGTLALVSSDFKMPQIFRTSLGFDKRISTSPFTVSADILYTKDIQGIYQFGANRKAATQTMYDGRDFYPNTASYTFNPLLGGNSGSVLSNTTLGHSFNFTAGVNMAPRKGLFGSLFYSYTTAQTTTDNQGSNASSAWGATPNRNNPNDLFLASSVDALPHRVVGTLSYRKEYFNHLATTVSLFYNGASQGRYTFTYNGDVNGDAIAGDLLYIPNDASEVNFVPITGANPFTVEQQRDAFNQLLNNSSYLNENRGKMADRNGALMPWLSRFDAKLLQDVFANIGKNKNTLQLSLDIVNLGNMLNSSWGIQKMRIANSNTPLQVQTRGENPTFRMSTTTVDGEVVLPTTMYQDVRTVGTTWSMQIGLRYLFN